jgi:hypothetical protein
MDLGIYEDVDNIEPSGDSCANNYGQTCSSMCVDIFEAVNNTKTVRRLFTNTIHKSNCEQFKSPRLPTYSSRPIRCQNKANVTSADVNNDEHNEPQIAHSSNSAFSHNFESDSTNNVILPVALITPTARCKRL